MFNKILVSFFILFSPLAFSDGIDPDKVIDITIDYLVSGKAGEAFDFALKSNPYFLEQKSDVDSKRIEFESFIKKIGLPDKCEKLLGRNLIQRFRTDVYLCLSSKQPFEITFEFYKQKDSWRVQSFSFSSKIDDLISQSLEVEIGKKSIIEQNK